MIGIKTSIELPMAHSLYRGAYSGLCVGNVYRDEDSDGHKNRYDLGTGVMPIQHGHNNIVTISLSLDDSDLNKDGMVLDFKAFKKELHKHFDKYDHSLLMTPDNPLMEVYKKNFKDHGIVFHRTRLFPIGENPTSEVLSMYWWYELYFLFSAKLGVNIEKLSVEYEETSHNSCTYSNDDTSSEIGVAFAGVYKLQNNKTGKIYIGQSANVIRRWTQELLRETDTVSNELKEAIANSELDDWDVSILERVVDLSELKEREKYWIEFFDATNPEIGYNVQGGDPNTTFEKGYSIDDWKQDARSNNAEAIKTWKENHPGARRESDRKYENTPCKDPITGETVTLTCLRARMKKHRDIYVNCPSAYKCKIN